jgi:hypothetical protein
MDRHRERYRPIIDVSPVSDEARATFCENKKRLTSKGEPCGNLHVAATGAG